jgi:hypothetical protein
MANIQKNSNDAIKYQLKIVNTSANLRGFLSVIVENANYVDFFISGARPQVAK